MCFCGVRSNPDTAVSLPEAGGEASACQKLRAVSPAALPSSFPAWLLTSCLGFWLMRKQCLKHMMAYEKKFFCFCSWSEAIQVVLPQVSAKEGIPWLFLASMWSSCPAGRSRKASWQIWCISALPCGHSSCWTLSLCAALGLSDFFTSF